MRSASVCNGVEQGKMADKRRPGPIVKGMTLTITVEEAVHDILVVSLEHGSRTFRGVLLDAKKRHLPQGICTSFGSPAADHKLVRRSNSSEHPGLGSPETEVELSATNFRHTYGQNLNPLGGHLYGPPHKNFPRLNGNKNVRNIRLRPRQTLCSKCKSSCVDSEKGPVPVNPSRKHHPGKVTRTLRVTNSRQPLTRSEMKKRKPPENFIEHPQPIAKQVKLEKPVEKVSFNVGSTAHLTKTSPFIKISIGEGTVVKIPPRIHEEKESEDASSEEKGTDDENYVVNIASNAESEDIKTVVEPCSVLTKKHKKSMKKAKERDKHCVSVEIEGQHEDSQNGSSHHKKHKKKHKHRRDFSQVDDQDHTTIIVTERESEENFDNKNENSEPYQTEVIRQRPRLLYTWRQNKGLSPRHESHSNIREDVFRPVKPFSPQRESQTSNIEPNYEIGVVANINNKANGKQISGERKEYKLRSKEKSLDSTSPYELTADAAYVSHDDADSVSDHSEGPGGLDMDSGSDSDSSDYGDGPPPGDENMETLRPLMMKIQTSNVSKCITADGRRINIGDIIWGKIQGFPWWPGRVLSISVSQRENGVVLRQLAHIAWFGSSTMSHIQCSDLFPFLEDFKLRFKRKKRGPYKMAIKQATIAAQNSANAHEIDFTEFDL